MDEDFATVNGCESNITVNRELSKGHISSETGMQTRSSKIKKMPKKTKKYLSKKRFRTTALNVNLVEWIKEPNEWQDEYIPLMNISKEHMRYQEENVNTKTHKKGTKQRRDFDEDL